MNTRVESEALSRLTAHLVENLQGLPAEEARDRAHHFSSIAHDELIKSGFHPDDATTIMEGCLVDVFRRMELGDAMAVTVSSENWPRFWPG